MMLPLSAHLLNSHLVQLTSCCTVFRNCFQIYNYQKSCLMVGVQRGGLKMALLMVLFILIGLFGTSSDTIEIMNQPKNIKRRSTNVSIPDSVIKGSIIQRLPLIEDFPQTSSSTDTNATNVGGMDVWPPETKSEVKIFRKGPQVVVRRYWYASLALGVRKQTTTTTTATTTGSTTITITESPSSTTNTEPDTTTTSAEPDTTTTSAEPDTTTTSAEPDTTTTSAKPDTTTTSAKPDTNTKAPEDTTTTATTIESTTSAKGKTTTEAPTTIIVPTVIPIPASLVPTVIPIPEIPSPTVTLADTSSTTTGPTVSVYLKFTLDTLFVDAFNDHTSSEYISFVISTEIELEMIFKAKYPKTFRKARVDNLRKGSVIVDSTLLYDVAPIIPEIPQTLSNSWVNVQRPLLKDTIFAAQVKPASSSNTLTYSAMTVLLTSITLVSHSLLFTY